MTTLRNINLSAAIILVICFFLPWEQVSCGGVTDSLTGWDLARHDQPLLWLVPVLMGAIVIFSMRLRRSERKAFWLANLISGLLAAYLMNRERLRVHDESSAITAQLTGWFWLSFLSTFGVIGSALAVLLQRKRAP